jgi:hypothetical protein
MILCAFQLNALVLAYEYLLKDKAILSAELLNEYDQKVKTCLGVADL